MNGRNAWNRTGDTHWLHRQSIRRGRLPISSILPNAELSPWANFCRPGLVEGILGGAQMDTTCIAGRGLRACPIVGRFDGVVIACRRECYFVTAGPNSRHERRNGRLGDEFDDGIINIACRGVELVGAFLPLRAGSSVGVEHARKPVAVKKEDLRIAFEFPC